MAALELEALGNVANMSCDKVSVSKLTVKSYISTENMLPDRGGIEIAAKLPTAGNVNIFSPGDVLFSNIRTYFKKVWLADRHGGASADVIVFRPRDTKKVDSQYLYYVLSSDSFIESTVTASKGTKMPRGDKDAMLRYTMPLPSFTAQRRIASILSAYDELIENNQRRIRILEDMARSLYREWFVHFRYPGHESVSLVDSPLGQIPQGWEVKSLNDVVHDIVDYRGKTPKKLNGEWSDEGILALSALNVKGGRLVNLEKSRCINEDLYSRWMKNPLRQGDILMTSEAPLGELFFLCKEERYCLSQRLFSIRANCSVIAPVILYLCMESEQTQHELRSRASGATVSGIRQSELRNVPIVVPPRPIQESVESVLLKFVEQIATLNGSLINLRHTRDLLLPRLLSGQVSLSEAEPEATQ